MMEPSRAALVRELVNRGPSWKATAAQLAEYPWDSETSVEFSNQPLVNALHDCARGLRDGAELAEWAEVIEMRDDIRFTDPRAMAVVFELANPELHAEFNASRARELERLLTD